MNEYFVSILLGLVQGLTEFIPVSSSGHLILFSSYLELLDDRLKVFEIVIQAGSVLAVVMLYWPRFTGLLVFRGQKKFSGFRGLWMLMLTSAPACLLGLVAYDFVHERLFNSLSVSMALAVGALFIFGTEQWKPTARYTGLDSITPLTALGIGCFQCLSLWPGFSRSTSTIMGAMLLGVDRKAAAEYSFIAAVPIMLAATVFSLYSHWEELTFADLPFFALGTLVSFLAALLAIKVLIRLVSRISFKPFAWYRLVIAGLVFWTLYY